MTMPCSLMITLLLLGFGLFHGTGAAPEENLPSAQLVGTVLCAPCFNRGFSRSSNFIPGASVLVECTDLGFRKEVTTDEHGKFEVRLPPSTSEDAEKTQGCTVKLIKSSNPGCDAVSSRDSLRLKLNRRGPPQVISLGVLAFTPREQPSSCARKPTRRGRAASGFRKGSINLESARRASILKSATAPAPITSPPVLGSILKSATAPAPAPVTWPPVLRSILKSATAPAPVTSPPVQPPSFPFPLPPSPPVQPPSFPFPLPSSPPFVFPLTPQLTPHPPSIHLPFPPLSQPLISSSSPSAPTSQAPFFPFPISPLAPPPPELPFTLPPSPEYFELPPSPEYFELPPPTPWP